MNDNPFALLEAASNELIKQTLNINSQNELDPLLEFSNILEKIKTIIPAILKNSSLISIYIYQFLRFLQQINYSVILISLEQGKVSPLLNIITTKVISTLKQLMNGPVEISEVCGREFLRFSLDHSLVSEFAFSTEIKNFAKPPKNEFIKTLIPKNIQDEIDESLVGEDCTQTMKNLQVMFGQVSPEMIHFLICDIIRYVYSARRLSEQAKTKFIKSLLMLIPHWNEVIYTFEVCIALLIDIFTFQRQSKEDDTNIRVCFNLIKDFPLLLKFVENLVQNDHIMLLFLKQQQGAMKQVFLRI